MDAPAGSTKATPVVEPVPGTPEYETAMAEKGSTVSIQSVSADGSQVAQVNTATADPAVPPTEPPKEPAKEPEDRPAWLPEKYATLGEFLQTHPDTKKPDSASEIPPAEAATPATQKFFEEYAKTGAISESSYAELAKMGLDKTVVDSYIAGQIAKTEARTQAGYAAVGGAEQFTKMTTWAAANLSPAEIAAFNTQVNSTNDSAMLAVKGLQARYTAAVGRTPAGLLSGDSKAQTTTSGFQSKAQVTQAMRDPRYESDPAYRKAVADRLRVTDDSVI